MSRRHLLIAFVGLLILGLAAFWWFRPHSEEDARARAGLDQMLGGEERLPPEAFGQAPPPPFGLPQEPPGQAPGAESGGGLDFPFSNLFPEMQKQIPELLNGGVTIDERPEAYVIRIPMKDKADESGVSLKVAPHHIELSNRTVDKGDHGSFSSSFMQSFSTASELLPDKVTREHRNGELVITIPKARPGERPPNRPEAENPPAPALSPTDLNRLNRDRGDVI